MKNTIEINNDIIDRISVILKERNEFKEAYKAYITAYIKRDPKEKMMALESFLFLCDRMLR